MPFSEPYERLMDDYENDDIVLDALESISGLSYRSNATSLAAIGVPESFSPRKTLSHRQKSVRLLQHCPSWTQLENTLENRRLLERQGEI